MPASGSTRRDFLKTASFASAAGMLGAAMPRRWLAATPNELLLRSGATSLDEAALRAVAHRAVEAAKAAGATYADVRVNLARQVSTGVAWALYGQGASLSSSIGVGIRAIAGGGWGFAACRTHAAEVVVRAAELAVARAKTAARGGARPFTLAPAPVVSGGRWETPVEIDPFTMPFAEIEAFLVDAATPVWELFKPLPLSYSSGMACTAEFTKSERVFASSEGSTILQRLYHCSISALAGAMMEQDPALSIGFNVRDVPQGHYGVEGLQRSDLKAKWTAIAERVLRERRLPVHDAEVGRYDVVFDALTMASLVVSTVAGALQLDRARGDLANSAGTTYAMPPEKMLGVYELGSPLLTLRADRSRPRAPATVAWDEDGVAPKDFVLVQDGVVVDYVSTRETALALAPWYQRRGRPTQSNGCAGGTGIASPAAMLPNLALEPGTVAASAEDLIADTKRGLYVAGGWAQPDQQLLNVMVGGSPIYQIVNGRITGVVRHGGLMFNTPQFWKQLDALGGAASVSRSYAGGGGDSELDSPPLAEVLSPPGRVRQINMISYGKEA